MLSEMGRPPQLRGRGAAPVPDDLRCRRSDGRQWRCPRPALRHRCLCDHHYAQSRRHLAARGPTASPKRRRPKRAPPDPPTPRGSKRRAKTATDAMLEELVRVAVRRRIEQREERELLRRRGRPEGEVTRHLPNGVMAIALPMPTVGIGNVAPPLPTVDWKLEAGSQSFLRHCFRSKNVELAPNGSQKKFPCGRRMGKGVKMVCHRCLEKRAHMVRCSTCRKLFCTSCIKKWYHDLSELEMKVACPICRGNCFCSTCMPRGPQGDRQHEEFVNGQNKVSKIRYAHYSISQLLMHTRSKKLARNRGK